MQDIFLHLTGGVWGQGPEGPANAGFYGQTKSWDHAESRDLDDLHRLISEGKIKFAEDGVILITACHGANTGYFARELPMDTGCTVYAATGKVREYALGNNWVHWLTFAEGPETDPITWKKFLPDGTEVDLSSQLIALVQGVKDPVTQFPAEPPRPQ